MPYKEKPITKRYYTISEVAKRYGVFTSKIRYYEREFNLGVARRPKDKNRLFTQQDILKLDKIIALINVVKLTIPGVHQWLDAGFEVPQIPFWAIVNERLRTQNT